MLDKIVDYLDDLDLYSDSKTEKILNFVNAGIYCLDSLIMSCGLGNLSFDNGWNTIQSTSLIIGTPTYFTIAAIFYNRGLKSLKLQGEENLENE